MFEIIKPDTHIDFIGKWRICVAVSVGVILLALAAIPVQGVRFGIDFAGGTELQVHFTGDVGDKNEGDIRAVLRALDIEEVQVVRYGDFGENEYLIRVPGALEVASARSADAETAPVAEPDAPVADAEAAGSETADAGADVPVAEEASAEDAVAEEEAAVEPTVAPVAEAEPVQSDAVDRIRAALAQAIGPLEVDRVEFVGPRVGAELRRDGLQALAIAALLILIYVAFRFSTRFAPGAVVALLHDVTITAGVFVILGMEFDLKVLAALLAIIGYSLNDTIIVYDRIRENLELHTSRDLPEVLNTSVNQTLSRTLLTSGTTMAAVLALLFVGGEVIRPFAIAMAIGIVVGTYSSIYVAAPTLLFLIGRFGEGGETTGAASSGGRPATPPAKSEQPRRKPRNKSQTGGKRKKPKAARG